MLGGGERIHRAWLKSGESPGMELGFLGAEYPFLRGQRLNVTSKVT